MSDAHTEVSRRRFLIGAAAAAGGGRPPPRRPARRRPGEADHHLLERPHRRRRQGDGRADRSVHPRDRHPHRAAAHPVGRSLREAPGLGSRRRGPGPRADPHRGGAPLRQRRRPGGRSTTRRSAARDFAARTTCPPPGRAARSRASATRLPLDVPQHILYLNMKVMKDAGLVGVRRPAARAGEPRRAGGHGQADDQGRHLWLRHRHREPRPLHVGLPQPALAERRQRLRVRSQARRRVAEPAAIEVAEFWAGARRASTRSPRRRTPTAATRSSRASSACGSRGRGTSPACARRRSSSRWRRCRVSSSSRWSGRCRTSTRSRSRRAADRAKRDAAWTHVRWMTDHVAEWTLKAGQVSATPQDRTPTRASPAIPSCGRCSPRRPNWQVGAADARSGWPRRT